MYLLSDLLCSGNLCDAQQQIRPEEINHVGNNNPQITIHTRKVFLLAFAAPTAHNLVGKLVCWSGSELQAPSGPFDARNAACVQGTGEVQQTRLVLFRCASIARSIGDTDTIWSLVIGSRCTIEFSGPPIWQLGHRTCGKFGRAELPHCLRSLRGSKCAWCEN